MLPFVEFRDFAFSQKKFLVFWALRIFFVFATFYYALQELEEFSKQNYSYRRSPVVYLFAILQFAFIFVCLYFFRRELDKNRRVTLEEFFLFLLRGFSVFLVSAALFVGAIFAIGYVFKISGAPNQEPSIYAKYAEILLIVVLFPLFILYSSIAMARFRALPDWLDLKTVARDGEFRSISLFLLFLSLIIFVVPILITGLPTLEDIQSQFKYAKIRLYVEILPFLLVEILHLALIFFFVRKFGGVKPEEEES